MLSKGKKIEYLCSCCNSPNITKCVVHLQTMFLCNDCLLYAPWFTRIKKSIKTGRSSQCVKWLKVKVCPN